MKDHNEVFERVIERKNEYEIKRAKDIKTIKWASTCLCMGLALVFGVLFINDKLNLKTDSELRVTESITESVTTTVHEDFSIDDLEVTKDYYESPSNNGNSEQQTPIVNPPFYATDNATEWNPITMISDYEADEKIQTTPQNNQLIKSYALEKAIEEYGDNVLFRVFVEIYSDGNLLVGDDVYFNDEIERLCNAGITVAFETYFDGENEHYYFTLHTYKSNIDNFPVNENYGYIFYLYDEKVI